MISSMHLFRRRTADFRLRPGAETFSHRNAKLHQPVGFRHRKRLGVGVGDDEVDTLQPGIDHVVDGIATTAANPEHSDAGLQLGDVRLLQIDGHGTRSFLWHGPHRRVGQFCEFKNSL
jgi:hypothetical protein